MGTGLDQEEEVGETATMGASKEGCLAVAHAWGVDISPATSMEILFLNRIESRIIVRLNSVAVPVCPGPIRA